ncbi:MAG: hypothetical protein M1829_000915 [Trizodia sp. TS-e1964]|nr:MAG: hypothetical protein M1829_000915 [Trizodia sp. TS-e1964]
MAVATAAAPYKSNSALVQRLKGNQQAPSTKGQLEALEQKLASATASFFQARANLKDAMGASPYWVMKEKAWVSPPYDETKFKQEQDRLEAIRTEYINSPFVPPGRKMEIIGKRFEDAKLRLKSAKYGTKIDKKFYANLIQSAEDDVKHAKDPQSKKFCLETLAALKKTMASDKGSSAELTEAQENYNTAYALYKQYENHSDEISKLP